MTSKLILKNNIIYNPQETRIFKFGFGLKLIENYFKKLWFIVSEEGLLGI